MLSITKRLAVLGVVLALPLAAARAEQPASSGPVQLSDQELEQVSAGDGSLLDLHAFLNITLKNIAVTVNVSNVPINVGAAVQANALGQAIQSATVLAGQQVTQAQTLPTFLP
jgi:sulfur carrier protein ThiS